MSSAPHGNSSSPRLVVFGCGYVGSSVVLAALARGWAVTALTRNAGIAASLRAAGVNTVVADLADDRWHEQLEARPQFALNCVGAGSRSVAGYRQSYLDGIDSILRWARENGSIGSLVYTSSTSVYPQGGAAIVDETCEVGATEEYGGILCETERRIMESRSEFERWFILRLAGIYGPQRHRLLDQIREGHVAGNENHHLNLIHHHDVVTAVEACLMASSSTKSQVFNVVDDVPTTRREIVKWLAGRLGVAVPTFSGIPLAGRRSDPPDRLISNRKLKAVLGWAPRYVSYREGYEGILSAG